MRARHRHHQRRQSHDLRGFTLIEIMIVAALIAVFSSLAVFSMREFVRQTKGKGTRVDAKVIASALSSAHFTHDFFPKIGYLSMSRIQLELLGQAVNTLPPDFDAMGFNSLKRHAKTILDTWEGPFLPGMQGRRLQAGTTTGYQTRVAMPTRATLVDSSPGSISDESQLTHVVLHYPADPYGNPYVVYLVRVDDLGVHFITSPKEEPNYFAAVVSYGANGVPGGPSDEQLITSDIRARAEGFKLYKRSSDDTADFVALKPEEYEDTDPDDVDQFEDLTRLQILTRDFGQGTFPFWDEDWYPGVMDPESDDIIHILP